MWNHWLNLAAKKRLNQDLELLFLGQSCHQITNLLTNYAVKHKFWNKNFQIHMTTGKDNQIDTIEVRDNPCTM
jgi:hypothetical protein